MRFPIKRFQLQWKRIHPKIALSKVQPILIDKINSATSWKIQQILPEGNMVFFPARHATQKNIRVSTVFSAIRLAPHYHTPRGKKDALGVLLINNHLSKSSDPVRSPRPIRDLHSIYQV
jgi:hypothetical protein